MNGMRDGLMDAERASAELERKYRESLRGMLESRLSPAQRGAALFGLGMSLAMVVFFVVQMVRVGAHARPVQWAGLAVGLLFSLGYGALALASLRGGRENLRVHAVIRSQLVWLFTVLLMALMLWAGLASPSVERGNQLILYGIVFFVGMGMPFFTAQVVRQSELRVREDVLRVQLALAQVQERLARRE